MNLENNVRSTGVSRRKFLAILAAAGAGLPLAEFTKFAGIRSKNKGYSREVCIFSKHLQWLDYNAMAETAADIGFDGVDIPVRPGGHVLPEKVEDDLPRAVEAVRNVGLDVAMMTTGIVDARDSNTEPILRIASELGIGYYRMGYLRYNQSLGVAKTLESYKSQFRDLAEMNKHYKIHGAYQNHAGTRVGGPVWDLWEILRDLDPRWIGCQYDVRHATVEGGFSWPLGLKLLSSYIKITAIKDFRWSKIHGKWDDESCPLGEGMVDFKKYFEIVKQRDIDGPISVHFEYPIMEASEQETSAEERRKKTIKVMQNDLRKLRSMIAEAGLS